jgi:hypothetical protein
VSNFFTPEFNNESAIAPWNASLEPTKAIIPQLDANRILTGGVGQEVNFPTLTPEAYDNIILPDASLTRMASAVSTDSNSSLPDSSVDLLTGQAMSEVYGNLSKFAADPDFVAKLNVPFGENWDAAAAKALAEGWFQGDFSDIPPVKVVSSAEIGGANGAFAAATDTIYLSKEFLTENAANPAAVADVLLEEIGHSVDARLNVTDSPGDEGAIFSRVVQGKELSEGELQGLKSEDDTANVVLGGEDTTIERNQQQWRVWRYADPRGKNSDFWLKPDGSSDQNGNRSDGKDGIKINWGQGSPFDPPNTDIVNPLDYFATSGATQANFEAGATYKFRVSADDALIMATRQIGKSNQNFITPLSQDRKQVEWQTFPNGIFKEYSWTPSQSGQYYVYFWHYDRTGDADLNISWEKTGQASSGSASTPNTTSKPITTSVPPGFNAIKNSKGVTLYESNNKSDYVQVVDLSQGASIKLLTGQQQNNTGTNGAYGGTSPKFKKESIDTFWNKLVSGNSNAFSVSNGAFFTSGPRSLSSDTNLSYPLKVDSQIFDGSDNNNAGSKLKLEIWNDRGSITQFNDSISSINNSSAPQVLVGLPKQTNEQINDPNTPDSRTYIGVEDRDSNGSNETVLILTSTRKTTADAAKILKDFGANDNEIMQLDGGGSTQMKAQGKLFVNSSDFGGVVPRSLPQAIGVVSG